jgi:hypothetical protein
MCTQAPAALKLALASKSLRSFGVIGYAGFLHIFSSYPTI